MKTFVILSMAVLSGCGCEKEYDKGWTPTHYVDAVGVVGPSTPEEDCSIRAVQWGIIEVSRQVPKWFFLDPVEKKGFMFIRSPEDRVPTICKDCLFEEDCARRWKDYPRVLDIKESIPGIGFAGYCKMNIFISRIPPRNTFDTLLNLVAHEWGCHEAAGILENDYLCNEVSRLIEDAALIFIDKDPDCNKLINEGK